MWGEVPTQEIQQSRTVKVAFTYGNEETQQLSTIGNHEDICDLAADEKALCSGHAKIRILS